MGETLRMDGYIRVSRVQGREGANYISPTVQREAIERWATFKEVEIDQWHVDEDQSGGTQDRPGLRAAMERIEAGETQGLVCWRLNRFARNVAGAIVDVERIEKAGAHLVFVEEDIDTTGPFGRMVLTILLAIATLERDNLRAGWDTAKSRAVARGVRIGGAMPGYDRTDEGNLILNDEAPIVREAFRIAAADGLGAATNYLERELPHKRYWSTTNVRRMLASPVYLGRVTLGEHVNDEAHDPLVSRAEWEAAQLPKRQVRRTPFYPLSGIATCASCGCPMIGNTSNKRRSYRCKNTPTDVKDRREPCPKPAMISADRLETHVKTLIQRKLTERGWDVSNTPAEDDAHAEGALEDAEAELYAFAQDQTLRKSLGSRYQELLDERVKAVDDAKEVFRETARNVVQKSRVVSREFIEGATPEELRSLVQAALRPKHAIEVRPGRGRVEDRVSVFARGSDVAIAPAE